ncbi:MAG: exo-alpha-sialidase [Candidatus Latescibacteria bacterium]|nr:exo-alpha-sialidase [Candidatus Latescibacterota bacterium]
MKNYQVIVLFFCLSVLMTSQLFAQWEADQRLTNTAGNSFLTNNNTWCIAASGDTIHVIYNDNENGAYQVYYTSSYNGGVNWNTPIIISQDLSNIWDYTLAVSGSTVHIIWENNIENQFLYRRSTNAGATWSAENTILTTPANFIMPCLAANGNNIYLVWSDTRHPVNNSEIYFMSSSDAGLNWSTPQRLTNTANGIGDGVPSIAVNGDFLHLVWQRGPGYDARTLYIRSTNNGLSWEPEQFITTDTVNQTQPCIAVSGNYVHTVWTDVRNDTLQIFYRMSQDNGINWEPEIPLTHDIIMADYQTISAIGRNVHVAWRDYRFSNQWHIGYRRSNDNGQTWQPDTFLYDAFHQESPSIAVAGTKVHLIWIDNRDGNWEIYYKRNPTGSGIEEQEIENWKLKTDNLSVFPNPASSYFTVRLLQSADRSEIKIFDVTGKLVGDCHAIARNDNTVSVSLNGIKNGVYFVKIGEEIVREKLVITK